MMVALIDQNDFRISSPERARRGDAGKTTPDDNNARTRGFRGWCWYRVFSLIIRRHCTHNGHQIWSSSDPNIWAGQSCVLKASAADGIHMLRSHLTLETQTGFPRVPSG
jgi:hypothetical protein